MTPAQDAARELARSILDKLKQLQGFETSIEVEDGIARDITAAFTQREADLRALAIKAVDAEEEFPGQMPDELWDIIRNDRDACQETMRIAVRETKKGIRKRIITASAKPEEKP